MVAHLVRNHISLREITRRAEALVEFAEEGQVDVNRAVRRTVKRSHLRARESAAAQYSEALDEIDQLESLLMTSPQHITLGDLKELGKLHRKAASNRAMIFRVWTRAEPPVKQPFWKKLFLAV